MVALKSPDDEELKSPSSFENEELLTYAEARKSTDPKPYIAAVFTEIRKRTFTLGDGKNTSTSTSRRRRSTSSDYHNGPLEPGTSYRIFQRVFFKVQNQVYKFYYTPYLERK